MNYNFKLTTVRKGLIFKTTIFLILILAISIFSTSNNLLAEKVFSPGQEDESVEELQNKLEELGFFSVSRTGLYGEETRRAVERFQAAANLKPDGIAGPTTLDAIDKALNSIDINQRERLKIYTHNVDVIYLQFKLSQLGYLSSEPTGLFRSLTQKAVKEFQKDHEVDSDGIVGQKTWQALEEEFDKLEQTTYDSNDDEDIENNTEETVAEAEEEQESDSQKTDNNVKEMDIVRPGDRGDTVVELQKYLNNLGIYPLSPDGSFGHQTELAVRQFQKMSGLNADGVVGPSTWEELLAEDSEDDQSTSAYKVKAGDSLWTIANRFETSVNDIRAVNNIGGDSIRAGQNLKIPGDGGINISQQSVEAISWSQVSRLFPRNSQATLTDVETGLSFRVKRLYGTNHADVEPLTAQDTNVLRRIYGGTWSWDRRAVIVNINGRLIAGSINGVPHGGQSINNNFDGHICLHFQGSRTHGGNRLDPDHQNMIKRAASQNWPLYRN